MRFDAYDSPCAIWLTNFLLREENVTRGKKIRFFFENDWNCLISILWSNNSEDRIILLSEIEDIKM